MNTEAHNIHEIVRLLVRAEEAFKMVLKYTPNSGSFANIDKPIIEDWLEDLQTYFNKLGIGENNA